MTRTTSGLPPGLGEMSGFAASRRHAGWAWGVRDSGKPASLYAFRQGGANGRFSSRELPVAGASNRDWEDVVYGEEAGVGFLYVVDTGARRIYKVAEPDPAVDRTAAVAAVFPYAFPDRSPSGCGPKDNVEAAFRFPAVTGPLHLVRKAHDPAGVYRFDGLTPGRVNVPVKVGALEHASCISAAAVSADNRLLVTASHDTMRVREGQGDLASLLGGPERYEHAIRPDNNEGGDFYPWGTRDIVIQAENRNTWHFGGPAARPGPDPAPAPAPVPAPAPDRPRGVMVGWHDQDNDITLLQKHERELGKRFAIVRLYEQWKLPGTWTGQMIRDGRLVIVSHKPPDPDRGGWAAVASGREDPMIRDLARRYRGYDREIVFTFHHEPHDDASDVKSGGRYGTSDQYTAAWRRIHEIFVAEKAAAVAGGKVYFGYTATWNWMLRGSPAGADDKMYPGDAYVDIFAHDRYNWAGCKRNEDWVEFSELWRAILQLADAHQKYVIPSEWGAPPAAGRRNEWFRKAAEFMKNDPLARRWMIGFAYYHSFHDNCHWDFLNQGTDGKQGWVDSISQDPYFTDTPFSLRPA